MIRIILSGLKWMGRLILGVFLCGIVFIAFWIAFTWVAQTKVNLKARALTDGMNEGQTTVAKLFNIKENEFFCIAQIYDDKPSNYSALIEAGMKIEDIPDYNKWPLEIVSWDHDDVRIMALSREGKLKRKLILASGAISTHAWPRHFGCFKSTHRVKVTYRRPKVMSGLQLKFPDIGRKSDQE